MSTLPQISRRSFLRTTAGALAFAGAFPLNTRAQQREAIEPLRIPPEYTGRMEGNIRAFDLEMQNGTQAFFPQWQTPTSGINGPFLGPTLRTHNGEKVRLNVTNSLEETSTLHWHGMHLPARMDGGPHQVVPVGETWSPEIEIRQKAATLWYHPHLLGKTAEHVWRGLAGMVWIDDAETDALDLPRTYGVDDIPLVLQDRDFSRKGRMDYDPGRMDMMMGMVGRVPLSNGTVEPFIEAKTSKIRLRILNGSNASFYQLGFEDGRSFQQIASDGGLLESPVTLDSLLLGPAERAEIVVDVSDGQLVRLVNQVNSAKFLWLEIRPGKAMVASADIPESLTRIDWLDPKDSVKTRRFDMETRMGPAMMFGGGKTHTINGKVMDMGRIDETVKRGDTEIWEIRNLAGMLHVFHMHDVQFQILDRNGQPPAANERGRKDTVLLRSGETVRIIMRFEDYADPDSPFMYHCHILEHEDAGMMGQFVVV